MNNTNTTVINTDQLEVLAATLEQNCSLIETNFQSFINLVGDWMGDGSFMGQIAEGISAAILKIKRLNFEFEEFWIDAVKKIREYNTGIEQASIKVTQSFENLDKYDPTKDYGAIVDDASWNDFIGSGTIVSDTPEV